VTQQADIAVQARAGIPFAQQYFGNVQCNGQVVSSNQVPEAGIRGTALADDKTLRFGRVADNTANSGSAYEFTLNVGDALTATSHRCELALAADATSGIPRKIGFWHAFSIKLGDWHNTTDEQALAQWHAGDASGGLLPIYTLLVRGNVMRLVLRYSDSLAPTRENSRAIVVWSTDKWVANQWLNFSTQALMSADPADHPFVKTWLNGVQIVNYNGLVGYNQPTVQSYAKHGIYHWVDSTNPWDMSIATRTMRLKRPLIARDPLLNTPRTSIDALLTAD
jgi:hypothetical protein